MRGKDERIIRDIMKGVEIVKDKVKKEDVGVWMKKEKMIDMGEKEKKDVKWVKKIK